MDQLQTLSSKYFTCQDKDGNEDDKDVIMDNCGDTEGTQCGVTRLDESWH